MARTGKTEEKHWENAILISAFRTRTYIMLWYNKRDCDDYIYIYIYIYSHGGKLI
jgi:hypothetical protein